MIGGIAQLGEHLLCTQGVRSSTLLTSTTSSLRRGFFILEVTMLTLDLHGLRHEDAKRKLELFINDHWGKMLKIITGHSSTMRGIVSSTAQYYDLDFTCCPLGTYIIIKSH